MTTENKLITIFLIFFSLYFTWQIGRAYGQNEINKNYKTRINNVISQSTECDLDNEPITSSHGLCFNGSGAEELINLVSEEDQPEVILAIVNNVK